MKKICLMVFLSISLLFLIFSSQVKARTEIYNILAKGSKWVLNVDGEVGILELLGGRGGRTRDGGWEMAMDIKWQNNPGTLKAWADGRNIEQRVVLNVQRKNGLKVTCEGYIAQETDKFMAGITKHPARPRDIKGAWYAIKKKSLTPRVVDTESPKTSIEVEGILVFTRGDKIKIRASAEDNVKVAKINIYVDGKLVKTCKAWECWYSEKLTQVGPHKCWAVAEDTSGNKGRSKTLEFMVHPTAKPGPALTTKIQPYHPNSQDKIKFIAKASHPSGVKSITIFINNRPVKTCNQNHCEYQGGPYPAGKLVWRVSAKSRDGGVTYGYDNTLEIKPLEIGKCSISGKVYGAGADAARVFFVILYGPNDLNLHRETKHFDANGRYRFTGLPNGRYLLVVDTRADIAIGPHPSRRVIECRGGPVSNVNFELK